MTVMELPHRAEAVRTAASVMDRVQAYASGLPAYAPEIEQGAGFPMASSTA